jgi:hypothetical protein
MPEALVLPSTAAVLVGTSADPAGHRLGLPLGFFLFHLLYILINGLSSLIECLKNINQNIVKYYIFNSTN